MFAASGTGALESAVANLIAPGDVAVVASCGKFGQRWAELCEAYGAETVHLEFEWGEKVDPAEVERALAERGGEVKALFTHPVRDVDRRPERRPRPGRGGRRARCGERVRRRLGPRGRRPPDRRMGRRRRRVRLPEGAHVARPAWRSPRSRSARSTVAADARGRGARNYYFDWDRTLKGQRKEPPDSPFTPAVTLIRALDVALGMIEAGDAAGGLRAPRGARPRRPRGGEGAWASSCSAPRTRTPTS